MIMLKGIVFKLKTSVWYCIWYKKSSSKTKITLNTFYSKRFTFKAMHNIKLQSYKYLKTFFVQNLLWKTF